METNNKRLEEKFENLVKSQKISIYGSIESLHEFYNTWEEIKEVLRKGYNQKNVEGRG